MDKVLEAAKLLPALSGRGRLDVYHVLLRNAPPMRMDRNYRAFSCVAEASEEFVFIVNEVVIDPICRVARVWGYGKRYFLAGGKEIRLPRDLGELVWEDPMQGEEIDRIVAAQASELGRRMADSFYSRMVGEGVHRERPVYHRTPMPWPAPREKGRPELFARGHLKRKLDGCRECGRFSSKGYSDGLCFRCDMARGIAKVSPQRFG